MINNTTLLVFFDPSFSFDKIGSRDIFIHGRQPLPFTAINLDIIYIVTVATALKFVLIGLCECTG